MNVSRRLAAVAMSAAIVSLAACDLGCHTVTENAGPVLYAVPDAGTTDCQTICAEFISDGPIVSCEFAADGGPTTRFEPDGGSFTVDSMGPVVSCLGSISYESNSAQKYDPAPSDKQVLPLQQASPPIVQAKLAETQPAGSQSDAPAGETSHW
jgi:hypothetical protein